MNDLLRAPWSDQPVRRGVRLLAWLFVLCGAVAITAMVYFTAVEGLPSNLPLKLYVFFFGAIYMTALVLSSAINGKAPHGWLPWETRSPKQAERDNSTIGK